MYIPEKFKETRTQVLHALMRAHPLSTLVAVGDGGPIANHVPLETLDEPRPFGTLRGHIARANPLWKDYRGGEALAIFNGPQAYVSPNLYASKQATGEVVPTWNYAVVHARGKLQFTHDADWLLELVNRLTNAHEISQPHPWQVADAPPPYTAMMLNAIVGFELTIESLVGKFKLSQNRTAEDRRGVLAGLERTGDANSLEMVSLWDRNA